MESNIKKQLGRIIIYGGLLATIILYQFGRSIWHPLYVKLSGRQTAEGVYRNIGDKIDKNWGKDLKEIGLDQYPEKICIIGLKKEQVLEIWTNDRAANILIKSYNFTAFSGGLGPKLKAGDGQIPEGLYQLEYLNPNSSYHLSIKINYPNKFDIECGKDDGRKNLGGDIFIHGKSVTIGCIPIGDANIEELFILVYKLGLENVKVIIAPNDLRIGQPAYENKKIEWLNRKYRRIKRELIKYKS